MARHHALLVIAMTFNIKTTIRYSMKSAPCQRIIQRIIIGSLQVRCQEKKVIQAKHYYRVEQNLWTTTFISPLFFSIILTEVNFFLQILNFWQTIFINSSHKHLLTLVTSGEGVDSALPPNDFLLFSQKFYPATYDETLFKFLFYTYEDSHNSFWSKIFSREHVEYV